MTRLVSRRVTRSTRPAGTVMVTGPGSATGGGGTDTGAGCGVGAGGSVVAAGGTASSSRAATVARSRDATLMSCTTAVWLRRCSPYSPTAKTSWLTVVRMSPSPSAAGAGWRRRSWSGAMNKMAAPMPSHSRPSGLVRKATARPA